MNTYLIGNGQKQAWNLVLQNKRGWREAKHPEKPTFIYGNLKTEGWVRPFDGNRLGSFHKKTTFFNIMKNNHVSCIPETYDSYGEFKNHGQNNNALWFYKLSGSDCGQGVTPFADNHKGISKMNDIIKNQCKCSKCDDEYVIQKGVTNLMLYDQRKFDLRVHVLITPDSKVYIYDDVLMRISKLKHSNCACAEHQCTNGSLGKIECRYTRSDAWPEWGSVYPSIEKSTREIINGLKNHMQKGRYLLIGFDYILDNNKKAWVLELNTYPCLYYDEKDGIQDKVTHMLNGMVELLINKGKREHWKYLMNV
jgi:hypothetical protein